MKIQNPADGEGAEFDMTPMIDIVFLLIAFFMIVATVLVKKIEIETPIALEAKIPKEFGSRTTISINRDGDYYSGVRPITLDDIKAIMVQEYARNGNEVKVYLRADANAEHQYVNDVMRACANAGISKIIFATFQSAN